MENKKANEIVKETENKEIAQAVQNVETEEQGLKLFVEREPFSGSDGKQYCSVPIKLDK